MEVFAIRHKPTQSWMPARMFKTIGRGWSYWTPGDTVEGLDGFDKNPRIFFTKRSAQNALGAWLNGRWEAQTGTDGDWETGYFTVDIGPAPMKPPVERKREDMEIVSLTLSGV